MVRAALLLAPSSRAAKIVLEPEDAKELIDDAIERPG